MISEKDLKVVIEEVLKEMGQNTVSADKIVAEISKPVVQNVSDDKLVDITAIDLRKDFHVPNPNNKDAYMKLKEITPARLGVGRAGARYRTETLTRFRADHAAAKDAVWNEVSDEFLNDLGLFTVQTTVADKDEYITRPDKGKIINEEGIKTIKEKCVKAPKVQLYLGDGLSSTAIEANAKDVLLAVTQGLKAQGIEVGTPFFLKYARVGSCDHIAEITDADVVAVLIGERPGLVTSESMSCYMTYKAYPGIPEAKRTVVSNIHNQGTNAAEAGAHIADIIKKMLDTKSSGLDLKL